MFSLKGAGCQSLRRALPLLRCKWNQAFPLLDDIRGNGKILSGPKEFMSHRMLRLQSYDWLSIIRYWYDITHMEINQEHSWTHSILTSSIIVVIVYQQDFPVHISSFVLTIIFYHYLLLCLSPYLTADPWR